MDPVVRQRRCDRRHRAAALGHTGGALCADRLARRIGSAPAVLPCSGGRTGLWAARAVPPRLEPAARPCRDHRRADADRRARADRRGQRPRGAVRAGNAAGAGDLVAERLCRMEPPVGQRCCGDRALRFALGRAGAAGAALCGARQGDRPAVRRAGLVGFAGLWHMRPAGSRRVPDAGPGSRRRRFAARRPALRLAAAGLRGGGAGSAEPGLGVCSAGHLGQCGSAVAWRHSDDARPGDPRADRCDSPPARSGTIARRSAVVRPRPFAAEAAGTGTG